MREPAAQHVIDVYNAKKVAPLADWPDSYAAWVQDGVCALEAAANKRAAAELEKAGRQRR